MLLHEFIANHRHEIIAHTRAKVVKRSAPRATEQELANGVPLFLDQLAAFLRLETKRNGGAPEDAGGAEAIDHSASTHGGDLLETGFTIAQVVHDYGDIYQAIVEVAMERREIISPQELQTLSRCLDNATASAVTEYGRRRAEEEVERQGFFAHELRNRLSAALLSMQSIRSGRVGVTGSTMDVLNRSLLGIGTLIDRSISDVRVAAGLVLKEKLRLAEVIEEIEIAAQLDAKQRHIGLSVQPVKYDLFVQADHQLLSSAISNLVQNALKFSRPAGHVWLRTRPTDSRVAIEIEDECGGLPAGTAESLFRPYEQRGEDRTGLGLGLAISREAVHASGGDISVANLPGRGCIFTVDLPLG